MTNEELDAIEKIYMSFGDNETEEATEILNQFAESYHQKKCAGIAGRIMKSWRENGEEVTLRKILEAIEE